MRRANSSEMYIPETRPAPARRVFLYNICFGAILALLLCIIYTLHNMSDYQNNMEKVRKAFWVFAILAVVSIGIALYKAFAQ